jgi:Flp pilus assembly protein TadB
VSERKKFTDDALTRGALAAVKNAAARAVEDLTLSDEEKARRELERARAARIRRWKWIAIAVAALMMVIAVVALLAKLWLWMIGLALVVAFAAVGYVLVKRRFSASKRRALPATSTPIVVHEEQPVRAERDIEQERRDAAAAAAAREKLIDEELAALKAKTRR